MIVKVQLPESPHEPQACISTQDGKINMKVPVDQVAKRFANKERRGFFQATMEVDSGQVIELGERVADQLW